MARHMSQLTSLRLRGIADLTPLLCFQAPALVRLKLQVPHKAALPPIVEWLNGLPRLESLALRGRPLPVEQLRCLHAITSFQVSEAVPHYPKRVKAQNARVYVLCGACGC